MDIPPSSASGQQEPQQGQPLLDVEANAPADVVTPTPTTTIDLGENDVAAPTREPPQPQTEVVAAPAEPVALDELPLARDAETTKEAVPEADQTAPLDLKESRDANPSQNEVPAATLGTESDAAAKDKTVHYSMDSLFGPYFELKVLEDDVEELAKAPFPPLMDVQNIIRSQFGDSVHVKDIQYVWENQGAELLAELMRENKEECDSAELERLFGKAGMSCLVEERSMEPFRLLECATLRTPAFPGGYSGNNVWLVDMPKIQPNRQILHADPQPYAKERCGYLESDDRMLYTPHNVIRWAYHKGQNTFMSNARLVRWSDGSVTLHVGEDMFSLHDDKSNASLHVLGAETKVKKGKVEIPAVLKAVNPSRHFVLEGSNAKSVTKEITNEAVLHNTVRQKRRLPYLTAPTPYVDVKKPAAERTLYEECVHNELERKRKVLEQMMKEGKPPTLQEQVAMDNEMWNRINSMTRDDMVRQQQETHRREAVRAEERQMYQRTNKRERNLDLEGGDADQMQFVQKRFREEEVDEDDSQDSLEERLVPLRNALEAVVRKLPTDSTDAQEVEGLLSYINSPDCNEPTVQSELPHLIKKIEENAPGVDVSQLRQANRLIFGE